LTDKIDRINEKHLDEKGEYLYGYADLSGLLETRWVTTTHALVIAKRLDDKIVDGIIENEGPTEEYLDLYLETNQHLDELAAGIVKDLEKEGIKAVFVKASAPNEELGLDFPNTLRSDFSHKMAATRAGLGWIGKTDLLVTHKYGPRVRFVTILADRPLGAPGTPIDQGHCGDCMVCVSECPAKTSTGESWTINLDRDQFYDAFKCRDHCQSITKEKTGKDRTICGICVAVCPFGRKD
jgi:epoxyqueuosine reductase QueG